MEAFVILSQGRDLERCGDLSWEDLLDKTQDLSELEWEAWVFVPEVTDVPVSPSSVVTEFCDGSSCCSDWDFVEPQSLFSKKRAHSCTVTQEGTWFEEPQVTAPPLSRRRIRPPTPLQKSCSSFQEEQGEFRSGRPDAECERQNDHCKDETVPGRKSEFIEELESLLGPGAFLVVSRSRWDKHKRRLNAPW